MGRGQEASPEGPKQDGTASVLETPHRGRFGGGDMQQHLARMGRQLEEMEAQHHQMFGGRQQPDRDNLAKATARYWQGMTTATRHASFIDVDASQSGLAALATLQRSPSSPTPGHVRSDHRGSPTMHSRSSRHSLSSLPRVSKDATPASRVSRSARSMTADDLATGSREGRMISRTASLRGSHATHMTRSVGSNSSPATPARSQAGGGHGSVRGTASGASTPRSSHRHQLQQQAVSSGASSPRQGGSPRLPVDQVARRAALQAYWERMAAQNQQSPRQPLRPPASSPVHAGDTQGQVPLPPMEVQGQAGSATGVGAASSAGHSMGDSNSTARPAAGVQVFSYPRAARRSNVPGSDSDSDDGELADAGPIHDKGPSAMLTAPGSSVGAGSSHGGHVGLGSSHGASSEGSVPPSLLTMMPEPSFNANNYSSSSSHAGSPRLPPFALPLALAHNITFNPSPAKRSPPPADGNNQVVHGSPSLTVHAPMQAAAQRHAADMPSGMWASSPPPRQPSTALEQDSVLMGSPLPHSLQPPAAAAAQSGPFSVAPTSRFALPGTYAAEPRVLLYEPGRYAGDSDTGELEGMAALHDHQQHLQHVQQLGIAAQVGTGGGYQSQGWPVQPASWSPAGPQVPSRWQAGEGRSNSRGPPATDNWSGPATSALPFSPSTHATMSPASSTMATPGRDAYPAGVYGRLAATTPYAAGSDASIPATPFTAMPRPPTAPDGNPPTWGQPQHDTPDGYSPSGPPPSNGFSGPAGVGAVSHASGGSGPDPVFLADLTATQQELRAAIRAAQDERRALDASLTQLTSAAAMLHAKGSSMGLMGLQPSGMGQGVQAAVQQLQLESPSGPDGGLYASDEVGGRAGGRNVPDLSSPPSAGRLAALKLRRQHQRVDQLHQRVPSPSPSSTSQQYQQQQQEFVHAIPGQSPSSSLQTPPPVNYAPATSAANEPGSATTAHSGAASRGSAQASGPRSPDLDTHLTPRPDQAEDTTGPSPHSAASHGTPQSRVSRGSSGGRAFAGPGGGGGVGAQRHRRASHDAYHSGGSGGVGAGGGGGFSPLTLDLPGAGTPTNSIVAAMQRRRRSMSEVRSSPGYPAQILGLAAQSPAPSPADISSAQQQPPAPPRLPSQQQGVSASEASTAPDGNLAALQAWEAYRAQLSTLQAGGVRPGGSTATAIGQPPTVLRLPGASLDLGHGATGLSSSFSPGALATMHNSMMQQQPPVAQPLAAAPPMIPPQPAVLPASTWTQPPAAQLPQPPRPAVALGSPASLPLSAPVPLGAVGGGQVAAVTGAYAGRSTVSSSARRPSAEDVPIVSTMAWPSHSPDTHHAPDNRPATARHATTTARASPSRSLSHHLHSDASPPHRARPQPATTVGLSLPSPYAGAPVAPPRVEEEAGKPSALQRLKLKCLQRHALSSAMAPQDTSPSRPLDQGVGLRRVPASAGPPARVPRPSTQLAGSAALAALSHTLRTPANAPRPMRGSAVALVLSASQEAETVPEAQGSEMESPANAPKPFLKRKSTRVVSTKLDWSHVKPKTVSRMADYDGPATAHHVAARQHKSPMHSPLKQGGRRSNAGGPAAKPPHSGRGAARPVPASPYHHHEHDSWSPAKPGAARPQAQAAPRAAAQHHAAPLGYEVQRLTGLGQYASPSQYRQAGAGRVAVAAVGGAPLRSPGSPLDDLLNHVNHLLRDFDQKFNVHGHA